MSEEILEQLLQEIADLKARMLQQENATPPFVHNFNGDGDGMGTVDRPWTFVEGEGWTNACVQIGYTVYAGDNVSTIANLSSTVDGDYYLKANLMTDALELVVSSVQPDDDFVNSIVHTYIGTVQNGVQTRGIYQMPVLYKYVH